MTWIFSFQATGDGPPVEIRVRRLLKAALRGYGLRCINARIADEAGGRDAEARDGLGAMKTHNERCDQ